MFTSYDDDLLREGILRFKAGEYESARRFLERALEVSDDFPTRIAASFYLSQCTDDPVKKLAYLKETLAMDPVHAEARRALAILEGRLKPEDIIDPDAPPAAAEEMARTSAERFTCPKCGGRMVYAADGRSLTCEYCSYRQNLGGKIAPDEDFFATMATSKGHSTPVTTQVFHCGGCGAEFIQNAQELSLACVYCGSAHVIRQSRDLAAPDAVIPFGFDRQTALGYLSGWLTSRRIKVSEEINAPHPLYMPVWTFDVLGNLPWSGQVNRNKQLLPISGDEGVYYTDIYIPAIKTRSRLISTLVKGFDFSTAAPYDPRYLAGWPAEVHSISLSSAALEARRIAVERVRKVVTSKYEEVINLRYQSAAISVNAFKLVLVPVWLGEYSTQGRSYPVGINGVTGVVQGETVSRSLLGGLQEED